MAREDVVVTQLTANDGGVWRTIDVNTTGIAGFLLAKVAAAHARRAPKDFYDIAYVLLHSDLGGHEAATQQVIQKLGHRLAGTDNRDRRAGRGVRAAEYEGARAYAEQVILNASDVDAGAAAADAVTVVCFFCERLLERGVMTT